MTNYNYWQNKNIFELIQTQKIISFQSFPEHELLCIFNTFREPDVQDELAYALFSLFTLTIRQFFLKSFTFLQIEDFANTLRQLNNRRCKEIQEKESYNCYLFNVAEALEDIGNKINMLSLIHPHWFSIGIFVAKLKDFASALLKENIDAHYYKNALLMFLEQDIR
jgi:hypothetical protein